MKKIKMICSLFMIVSGLLIIAYPIVSNLLYRENATKLIQNYESEIAKMEQNTMNIVKDKAKDYNYQLQKRVIKEEAKEYDNNGQSYLDLAEIGGTIGYIKIPKIDVNLPIYQGAQANVLQRGIGHVEHTSFPVGGESTHSVLTGHRGMTDAVLFTDLDLLEEGDMFYLYVLDGVLAYQVEQVKTVEPNDTSDLGIVRGKDYCTLVTCTPYAINSHRLLVRGIRVPYAKEEIDTSNQAINTGMVVKRWGDVWPFLLASGIVILGSEMLVMITMLKRYWKNGKKDD